MSANIFKVKINSFDIETIPIETLIVYCFENPRLFYSYKYIELLSIELDKDDSRRNIPYARFIELLRIHHKKFGDSFFAPLVETYAKEFQILKESYHTNCITELTHSSTLILNNILAELKVEGFSTLPVLKIDIELAQDHDGILAFPNHRWLGINSMIYREFMIMVLADIQNEMVNYSSETIREWFDSRNGKLYPEYPDRMNYGTKEVDFDCDEAIIWGIEEKNEIIVESSDTTFADIYVGAWWVNGIASAFEYWKNDYSQWVEANKEYPFKIKTFSILVHPAWFDSVKEIDLAQIYDSTAYGY